jgi:TolB-like protein
LRRPRLPWTARPAWPAHTTVLAAGMALLAGVVLAFSSQSAPPSDAEVEPVLLVRPFAVGDRGAAGASVADGVHAETRSALAQIAALRVTSRSRLAPVGGRSRPVRESDDIVGARWFLDGRTRMRGGRITVHVRLLDATSQVELWSMDFQQDSADVGDLGPTIARAVADALEMPVAPAEHHRLDALPRTGFTAFLRYHGARRIVEESAARDARRRAENLLREALDADPTFAPAHALRAGLLHDRAILDGESRALLDSASLALHRAATTAPQLADLLHQRGRVWAALGDAEAARHAYEAAVRSDPGHSAALRDLSRLLFQTGRLADAIFVSQRRGRIDPSATAEELVFMADAYALLGLDSAADAAFRRAIALHPFRTHSVHAMHWALRRGDSAEALARAYRFEGATVRGFAMTAGEGYLMTGRLRHAGRALRHGVQDNPAERDRYQSAAALYGLVLLMQGQAAAARSQLLAADSIALQAYAAAPHSAAAAHAYGRAGIAVALGDIERGLALLDEAAAAGFIDAGWLVIDPFFEAARGDERLDALIGRMRERLEAERSQLLLPRVTAAPLTPDGE